MKKLIISTLILGTIASSCKKKEDPKDQQNNDTQTQLPTMYNFSPADYSGQTARLDMLAELSAEMKKANDGTQVDSAKLLNMFANTNSPFSDANLNTSTKQLKNKCYNNIGAKDVAYFEYLMKRQGQISANAGNTWSAGNVGVATSGTKKYFLDEYGAEYAQIVEKGLMGAIFYYQIAETYTRDAKIGNSVDNTTSDPVEGTPMEHHWDEAFGYWGAPTNFSTTNNTGGRFHAKYSPKGDAVGLNTSTKIMNQFIKGRYGISNQNYTMRDEAAVQVRKEYEMIMVTSAIHYLNSSKSNFADDALRCHALSEAYGFIFSLAYNSDKTITTTDLATVMGYLETTVGPTNIPDFVNITITDINNAIDLLSTTYSLEAVKSSL